MSGQNSFAAGMPSAAEARTVGPVHGRKFTPAASEAAHSEHAPIHPQALVQGQHGRDGHEERDGTRPIQVNDQREERRAHHDPPGPGPDHAQDAADDRVEEAGVGHDPEVEDREDEHPRERGHVPDAAAR